MQIRRGTQVNCNTEDHTLHACRKVPSGYDKKGALRPSRHVRARTVLWAPTFVLQCCGRRHLPSGTDPDRSTRHLLWSRRKLASPTVTGVRSLCRLLPVGSRIRTLVRRADRRSGMGCDHLLTKPKHGIISGQTPSVALSGLADMHPAWSYP